MVALQAERALRAMAEISLTFPDGSSETFRERRILGRGSPKALRDSGLSKEQCQLELVEGLEQEFVISVTNLGKNCELSGLQAFLPLCRILTLRPCSADHRAPASWQCDCSTGIRSAMCCNFECMITKLVGNSERFCCNRLGNLRHLGHRHGELQDE